MAHFPGRGQKGSLFLVGLDFRRRTLDFRRRKKSRKKTLRGGAPEEISAALAARFPSLLSLLKVRMCEITALGSIGLNLGGRRGNFIEIIAPASKIKKGTRTATAVAASFRTTFKLPLTAATAGAQAASATFVTAAATLAATALRENLGVSKLRTGKALTDPGGRNLMRGPLLSALGRFRNFRKEVGGHGLADDTLFKGILQALSLIDITGLKQPRIKGSRYTASLKSILRFHSTLALQLWLNSKI